jgi:protein-S-isoprenylcysteine O-methyltransferase Ste14
MSGLSDVGLVLNLLFVVAISTASYNHFDRRETEPVGATLLSFATLVGAALNTLVWFHVASRDPLGETIAIVMAITAGGLFMFALSESRGGGLLLAFSSRTPPEIIEHGIYARVRHPFYLSYMLFWWDWWPLNGFHPVSLMLAALMTAIYVIAARKEELLLAYRFGTRYIDYARRTKQFVPWLY